tara:strand:- start:103 stop:288 length:186 start_codon:yes stop_codon:yes gene_type:complete
MKEIKSVAASWARSFLAAGIAVYMAGINDPKAIAGAGLAAVLPVILRYLNPHDASFGVKGK